MNMCSLDNNQCSLAIAGVGVTIACDDPSLAAALRERYGAFPLQQHVQLRLQVGVVETDAAPRSRDLDVVLDGEVVRHADPTQPSCIHVGAGHGELVVARPYAPEETEYWLRVVYALLMFRAGGLLFHAAGIVRGGRAFLFCGRSGSGKTTVARLSPHDIVLNDDLVALMPNGNGSWIAHATPFSNPTQVQSTSTGSAPVAAVLRLVQNKKVNLAPIHGGLALAELISNVPVLAADPWLSRALFARCEDVLRTVPLCRLHFLPDDSFWPVAQAYVAQL